MMKKFFLLAVLTALPLAGAKAQIGELSLELTGSMALADNEYGADKCAINAVYLLNSSEMFKIGVGAGLSFNEVRLNERHQLFQKEYGGETAEIENVTPYQARKKTVALPVFLKAKLIPMPELPVRPYLSLRAGTRLTSVRSISKNRINPFVAEAVPAIGFEIRHFGAEVGIDLNYGRLDNQYWVKRKILQNQPYSQLFDRNELSMKFTSGVFLAVIYRF